jgi:hypothetical protein
MKLLVFVICCGLAVAQEKFDRNGKVLDVKFYQPTVENPPKAFSLFSVVQFPNIECTSASTDYPMGTCYAATECTEKGGAASGTCAAGFGVCCVFKSSTCGAIISNNMTYISNPNYPVAYAPTSANTCAWTVNKVNMDVCQLRLDFETMVQSVSTSNIGCCGSGCIINSDSFTAVGENSKLKGAPVICGKNTGYHMYVDLGTAETSTASLTFYSDPSVSIATRLWNVKVSQIECDADWRAPQGCTQYFMGIQNTLYSYNHLGALAIADQDMTYCVRREMGYCGLRWKESSATTPDPFGLDTTTDHAAAETQTCVNAWISIPGGITFASNIGGSSTYFRHCGIVYGEEASTVSSESNTTPSFALNYFTKPGTTAMKATDTGFAMKYEQQPCS